MRTIKQLIREAMMEEEMNKPDIYIYKVKYDDNNAIARLKVKFTKPSLSKEFNLSRDLIVSMLNTGKLSIKTRIYKNGKWIDGDDVSLYGDKFITTDGNGKKTDNLGNLPKF